MESKNGEQGWRARVQSKAGIVLLRNSFKKPATFKKKAEVVAVVMQEGSPTSVV